VSTDSHVNKGARVQDRRRVRRTAEAARAAILAAAQRRLLAAGPDGLRLQEIAADVGISHPAILHHFGSREGLVEAVVAQTMREMQAAFIRVAQKPRASDTDLPARVERTAAFLEETHRAAAQFGYARLLAWLALNRWDAQPLADETLTAFPRAIHEQRVRRRRAQGLPIPTLEDTLFGTATLMFALLGEALFWTLVPRALGVPAGKDVRRRYLRWLARLVESYEPEAKGRQSEPEG
jgi:AcrR family transcriptional regulator